MASHSVYTGAFMSVASGVPFVAAVGKSMQ